MAPAAVAQGQRMDAPRPVYVSGSSSEAGARKAFAVLASLVCVAAGVWAMASGYGSWHSAVGLYFVGKGLFVGPMLWFR